MDIITCLLLAAISILFFLIFYLVCDNQETTDTRKIKYAIEHTITLSSHFTDEDIDRIIKSVAGNNEYIWCYEDEDLFGFEDN